MAFAKYHKLFLIRFISYFCILTGIIAVALIVEPVITAEIVYRKDQLLGIKFTLPSQVITSQGTESPSPNASSEPTPTPGSGFASLKDNSENIITPVSTDYGIVIEKINANARVVPDVSITDYNAYIKALSLGVAEAVGSTKPGENGNLFLFSHSTDAPWNIIRYNAIFYLLSKLEPGDRVVIFYQGRRYDYIVFDKTISKPTDLSFLTNRYDKPVLTLQTCDPPGTLINRLIVRAKLAGS